jgi:hypothetical protein
MEEVDLVFEKQKAQSDLCGPQSRNPWAASKFQPNKRQPMKMQNLRATKSVARSACGLVFLLGNRPSFLKPEVNG